MVEKKEKQKQPRCDNAKSGATNTMIATGVTGVFSNMQFEGSFRKQTLEKSQTNATSVTMHLLKQAI